MKPKTFYSFESSTASSKKRARWLAFLFILMVALVMVYFFLSMRYHQSERAYLNAYVDDNLSFQRQGSTLESGINILLLGLDYPDEGRLEAKSITSLAIANLSAKEIKVKLLDPERLDLAQDDFSSLDSTSFEQIGSQVSQLSQEAIDYYWLVDYDQLAELVDQFPGQRFQFDRDYHLDRIMVQAGSSETLTKRQMHHILAKSEIESQMDWNQRQINIWMQYLHNWSLALFSNDFEAWSQALYGTVQTNMPFSLWIKFVSYQYFLNQFEITLYTSI
ncbi:hypothetical protein M0R79_06200 [Ignavigranum ruoffiae]|uniref:hypothetical protein n=1 Tax=Ignavigranum ruoffiae TaxID=89093 RepID=UPI00206DCA78|nr:hypothetical protein [Ignavigranum ruoffiae]UPQ85245.1 hypothetical protein M0R79_06200 [Ignavigranum ruoffiae]